ncbi:hypothetical protein NDI37_22885 [Funiculus sociatus GB2-A5]|uniref:Uncharacterized protein n=1 Tax=Funiculus sociatus GB2-A5 TaxID=2933946 RepID=A0ABV0JV78_9CYAN|nr:MULTISPECIES: hypothetical protein [unclassified Trichocoleus]MBD1906599.1 hypothetical protein [Trichocoleus sp. FACHB-832]MBD2062715.1 hypothetical protein [Trichocoleus sp. FACHB-6]
MSPSVNRFSDLPESSGDPKPEPPQTPNPLIPADTMPNSDSETTQVPVSDDTATRQQPIPPPSEPMQYRAIGLVRGKYTSSEEQFTRGMLLASDGTDIDAVLLGRVMSLVKNHLNLEQEHLWVVYPRMRQEDGNLHVQIVGVWEPERLNQPPPESEAESTELTDAQTDAQSDESVANDGYFSIRGEVIYQSPEEEDIVIKIKQSPRKDEENPKFFKLKLKGIVQDKAVGHFMDVQVQRQGNNLVIQESKDIGRLPPRKIPGKKPFRGGGGRPPGRRPTGNRERPMRPAGDRPAAAAPQPKRREPLPKPVKRSTPPPESKK